MIEKESRKKGKEIKKGFRLTQIHFDPDFDRKPRNLNLLSLLDLYLMMTLSGARRDAFLWGKNQFGQLGFGYESLGKENPTKINIDNVTWTQIACGDSHTVAISTKGEVFTWGHGSHDELGHGDDIDRNVPTKVEGLSGEVVVKVACGDCHTSALTAGGKVFTW